jgi:trehalose synthase
VPLDDVAVTPLDPTRFRDVLSPQGQAQFEHAITRGRELLDGRTLWNVNSTAHGGGVAEMLRSLIGYVRGVGIDARWITIGGDPEFFQVTKRLHNRLHGYAGDGGPLGEAERAVFERVAAEHADLLAQRVGPRDVVILHDPQTAGMVMPLVDKGVPVIGAHIGLDVPNERAREAWRFLIGYVEPADAYVFSRRSYTWEGLDESKVTVIARRSTPSRRRTTRCRSRR